MVKMAESELRLKLLEMMKWFHGFCLDNHIRYYAIGGTLLGAVRHGGFIPWDDDMDIGVPRKDYERLINLMGDKINYKYILESTNSKAKEYIYPHSKLFDTMTTVIENTKTPIKRGLSIDIFPLDGIGNSVLDVKRNFKEIKFLLNLHTACSIKFKKNRSLKKNVIVLLMMPVSKVLNVKSLGKKIDMKCRKYDFDDSLFCGNLVGRYREKEIVKREVFGNPTLYKFENIEIFGVEKYDDYLSHIYGNWRELPPLEKRISMHNILYSNLSESYLK